MAHDSKLPSRDLRLYWWLLECAHYGFSELGGDPDEDSEMPEIACRVCKKLRLGVRREPGFAQFGD